MKRISQIILIGTLFVFISSSRNTQQDTRLPAKFGEQQTEKHSTWLIQASSGAHSSSQASYTLDSIMIRKQINELKRIQFYFAFNNDSSKNTEG